jgi:CBS domain containing-hemolysin-like protein
MEELYSFLIIFGLIVLNGTFVASEFAIARIRKTRIDHIASSSEEDFSRSEIRTAKHLQKVTTNINDYISACQIGITISSLVLGAVAEARLERIIAPILDRFFIQLDSYAISIIIAISIITFFHVILGEIVPKNIAILYSEKVAFAFSGYLAFLYIVFKIPVMFLNTCSNLVLRIFKIDVNFHDDTHSEAELKMILSSSQAQGILEEEEEKLMQNVFEFNDTIARDIMVPRSDMFVLSSDLSIKEAGEAANRTGYSRVPVYQDRVDNIIGYFTIRDILKEYQIGDISKNITCILSEALKASDGIYVIDLLKLMQEHKKQIAVLIDEFGGVSGLVTAEDIVEEIFGEINDEDDKESHEEESFRKLDNGDIIVDGLLNLGDVNEELGTKFKSERFDTIGGYVFGLIGTEPKPGDRVKAAGQTLVVEKHENNRVRLVRILYKAS